jgi:hypothetical protein
MKLISELPDNYKYLAELRRKQNPIYNKKVGHLIESFWFDDTLEGQNFWRKVYLDKPLPPLKPRYRIKGSVITKMW